MSRKFRDALPPSDVVRDHRQAYEDARDIVDTLVKEIDRLYDMVDWAAGHMKNDLCRASLISMKNDPNKMPIVDKKPKKKQREEPEPEVSASPDPQPDPPDDNDPLLEDLPPDTRRFLVDRAVEEMSFSNGNFEHVRLLRQKGVFVVEGADNRLAIPLQLSPFGLTLRKLLQKRRPS